ncbi:phage tail sheath subtilisin-like domain-containing protein [Marinagarivorans algicola]|uniref:phage tail sheath subtilisin-like domain-containing protein n=1 Tax=Marinagarivorans algicola TaxID=1513270 RepID=UPI0006B471FD|nr:phage tail sheath subtilisin-like domain-containing protein [Marinagarivorans algicola]
MAFLHGIEVIELDNGARPIRLVNASVIGLVGTAPAAASAAAARLTLGSQALANALTLTAVGVGAEGNAVSIDMTVAGKDNALTVTRNGNALSVVLGTDKKGLVTTTAVQLAEAMNAGDSAALVVASVLGEGSGIVDAAPKAFLTGGKNEPFPLNTPALILGSARQAKLLGTAGTLPAAVSEIFEQVGALVVVVRVAKGSDPAETMANVVTGIGQLKNAKATTGYKPRLLIATGFSHDDAAAKALESQAKKLRGIAYVDNARTATIEQAMRRAKSFGERVDLNWPWVQKFDADTQQVIDRPYSAFAAGLRVRIDAEKGFWWSKSNQEVYGVLGTAQPVDFSLSDRASTANVLNENNVSTVIREGGFRHWGNRTCSADPKWAFEQTRRTADVINDSIELAHQWAVDRNITATFVDDVTAGANSFLRSLRAQGAILDGRCWADPDLNTANTLLQGIVYFDFDFKSPDPAEHIIFRSQINNGYLTEVFA